MVGISSIIAILIVFLISVGLPVAGLLFVILKYKGEKLAAAWGIGAAGFIIMQVIIRLPILSVLKTKAWFISFATEHYLLYCLILGCTAALFELAARVAGVLILKKKGLSMRTGVSLGLGHGGIECIVLIGSSYLSNLANILMINTGKYDELIQQTVGYGVDAKVLEDVRQLLISTKPVMYYLAGYERILTMCLHVALTAVVCYFAMKGKTVLGALIAFALHAIVDSLSGILSGLSTSYLGAVISQNTAYIIIYIFLTAVAVASIVATVKMCRKMKEN